MHKSAIPTSAVLMIGLGTLLTSSCSRTENALAGTPDVPTVAVARTTTENLSRDLILTAEFRPFQEVDVMAKVAGYIKRINVDVGDRHGGDVRRPGQRRGGAQPVGSGARQRRTPPR
jgi:multidrug efflux pump subunit AcrA (membrane-fusion protein)